VPFAPKTGWTPARNCFTPSGGVWLTGDFNGDGRTHVAWIMTTSTPTIDTFASQGNGNYTEAQTSIPGFDATSGNWI
jgi:hypothetical protein